MFRGYWMLLIRTQGQRKCQPGSTSMKISNAGLSLSVQKKLNQGANE